MTAPAEEHGNAALDKVPLRRVVTGRLNGRSVVTHDGPSPRHHVFKHVPGMQQAFVWSTPPSATLMANEQSEAISASTSTMPRTVGETRFLILTVPPTSWLARKDLDPVAAAQELVQAMGQQDVDVEEGGFHATNSIDYVLVLEGQVELLLDDEEPVLLKQHDIVIQRGTRHAWRNLTDRPCVLAVILIGAERNAA